LNEATNEHLSTQVLTELYDEACRTGHPKAAEVHPHLATCSLCQKRFEEQIVLDRQFEQLHSPRPALRQSDCPDVALWREIAAGVPDPGQALAHIQHASRCDHCGTLLRDAVADLNGESALSDEERIAALESARPEWQRSLAERITGRVLPERVPWWKEWLAVPRLATVSAAAIVVVAIGWYGIVQQRQPQTASRLIARAYTDQRTLELRMAGAGYAPLRVQRGPAESFVERSADLLKAESIIASQLPQHPTDPEWLQAKAQADLLEGKYDAAVESLKRALELAPNTPGYLIDLSTAYFQRARQEDRPEDYGAAYEHLSQVLAGEPDNAVALYNRAIVSEQQFLYHQALDDWEHFLKVDPRSEWAAEARTRAEAIRAKLKAHENRSALLTPDQIASRVSDPSLVPEVDQRVEEYLHEAVRAWLPAAFPERKMPPSEPPAALVPGARTASNPEAVKALFFLADLTARLHKDRWLGDVLAGSAAADFPKAVAALEQASKANERGDYDLSNQQGALAEQAFRASASTAGVFRARFEQIFSAQMSRRSEECRRSASDSLARSQKYSFSWLQIQFSLENSVCSNLMGDSGISEKNAERAMALAHGTGYGALYLRAIVFLADNKFGVGDQSAGWKLCLNGEERYWSGQFSPLRGYSLYHILGDGVEVTSRSNLQVAVWREAAGLIEADNDLLQRAWVHSYIANAAAAAHRSQFAEEHYAEAGRLFALAPSTEASRTYALESEIRIARLEARLGRFDPAMARLASMQARLRSLSNNYLLQMFYTTLGELQLRRRHVEEAEQALRPALALAEQNLASLNSETERESWRRDAAPVYLSLSEAELVQGREQASLEMYEFYLGAPQRKAPQARPTLAATSLPAPDPPSLASRLPRLSHETVLTYAVLPDGVAAWAWDDRGVHAEWITKSNRSLQELTERFYDLSSDPKSAPLALRRDGRALYKFLIAPLQQWLIPGRTLVIEADGWLARVPFEALIDSGDHYLVERWAVVHSLGQDSDAQLDHASPISGALPALVVASTASSAREGLPPLVDVEAEADAVARRFQNARVLQGSQATLSAIMENLPSSAVFHFAGHALASRDQSGLMLARANGQSNAPAKAFSLMDATTLRRLNLQKLQLAVLSACSTGSGAEGAEDSNNLSDVLLRAGVPHVVASRWAVVETRRFMDDFYRNALAGQPVSAAIRTASLDMLADTRTAHPYYWSAFSAYGLP
jgi:CHAT domain-containing protein/cytochrome c-type biogenesis protein CcmH/NrfG